MEKSKFKEGEKVKVIELPYDGDDPIQVWELNKTYRVVGKDEWKEHCPDNDDDIRIGFTPIFCERDCKPYIIRNECIGPTKIENWKDRIGDSNGI